MSTKRSYILKNAGPPKWIPVLEGLKKNLFWNIKKNETQKPTLHKEESKIKW